MTSTSHATCRRLPRRLPYMECCCTSIFEVTSTLIMAPQTLSAEKDICELLDKIYTGKKNEGESVGETISCSSWPPEHCPEAKELLCIETLRKWWNRLGTKMFTIKGRVRFCLSFCRICTSLLCEFQSFVNARIAVWDNAPPPSGVFQSMRVAA